MKIMGIERTVEEEMPIKKMGVGQIVDQFSWRNEYENNGVWTNSRSVFIKKKYSRTKSRSARWKSWVLNE